MCVAPMTGKLCSGRGDRFDRAERRYGASDRILVEFVAVVAAPKAQSAHMPDRGCGLTPQWRSAM